MENKIFNLINFTPTHYHTGNEWVKVNPKNENWLKYKFWIEYVHHIENNCNFIVIFWKKDPEYINSFDNENKSKLEIRYKSTLYKGICY